MKKYTLGIIIIVGVIFLSGCITDSNNEEEPKTLAQNGVLLKYPPDWVTATSQDNDTIVSIANPKFVDSNTELGQVSVIIQKKSLSSSLDTFFNQTYAKLFSNSSYKQISEGSMNIGDYEALVSDYTVEDNNIIKQHRAIWIESNGYVYVILCTAPQSEFQNQLKYFEYILNNFKIT
jgi:hypothetical protein